MHHEAARVMDPINREAWRDPSTVRWYNNSEGQTDPGSEPRSERVAAATKDQPILDLGVGGGRTVLSLRAISRDYTAIDYATGSRVLACKARYPDARVLHGDAPRPAFRRFAEAVVPACRLQLQRHRLRQPRRPDHDLAVKCTGVLRPGGVFVFSAYVREATGAQGWGSV